MFRTLEFRISVMKIGVLALQGAVPEHVRALRRCGAEAVEVKEPSQLSDIDGLILPGGESTTIGKLMERYGLLDEIKKQHEEKALPIFGTCAGMILLAKDIEGSDQHRLGLMDICVRRNAFGRQVDSFEEDVPVNFPGNGKAPESFHAVFIRAPFITHVKKDVKILSKLSDDRIIFVRQGNLLASSFHPELTADLRIHKYFIMLAAKKIPAR